MGLRASGPPSRYVFIQFFSGVVDQAVDAFNDATSQAQAKNDAFQKEIDAAQHDLDSGNQPFDGATRDALTTAVANTRRTLRNIPDVPLFTDEIKSDTDELNKLLDYSADIKTLDDARVAFEQSAQQLKPITNPSQDFVISRLSKVAGISDIEPVNEEKMLTNSLTSRVAIRRQSFLLRQPEWLLLRVLWEELD